MLQTPIKGLNGESMSNIVDLSSLFHRSKDRICEFGEVFTPERFVDGMLDLLSRGKKNFWANEEVVFFEPTCGHGNIVISIFKRRLDAIFKKAENDDVKNPAFYTVANALNTMWAIDIDSENIMNCRTRLLVLSLEFLKETTGIKSDYLLIQKNQIFFAHVLCALKWQICENEALSALTDSAKAPIKAKQTRIGGKWFLANGHKELDFDLTWTNYYQTCSKEKTTVLDFERAEKFISGILNNSIKGYSEFDFAKFIVSDAKPSQIKKPSGDVALGV